MAKKKELTPEEKIQQALVPKEEQPYPLPEGWKWVRLGDITKIVGGGTPSSSVKEYYEDGDIAWISPSDLSNYSEKYISYGAKNITKLGLEKSSAQLMPKGTVLLSSRAPIGYVVIAKIALSTNQGFKNFLPSLSYLPDYLYWYLKGNTEILKRYASGTTFLELSAKKASLIKFPLAPIEEQKRLVQIIEKYFYRLDKIQEILESVPSSVEKRKAAIFHKAFTGELTAKWREEHNVLKSSWKKKILGDVLKPMLSKKPEGFTFRYIDIDSIDNKRQEVKEPKVILTSKAPSRASRQVEEGDIIFSMVRPYLKNIALIDSLLADCIVSTGFYVCKCKDLIYSKYLYYLLCSDDAINYFMQFMKGDNSPSIRKDEFLTLPIFIPELIEQKKIVDVLESFLKKEEVIFRKTQEMLKLIKLTRQSILSKAFRGEM